MWSLALYRVKLLAEDSIYRLTYTIDLSSDCAVNIHSSE